MELDTLKTDVKKSIGEQTHEVFLLTVKMTDICFSFNVQDNHEDGHTRAMEQKTLITMPLNEIFKAII